MSMAGYFDNSKKYSFDVATNEGWRKFSKWAMEASNAEELNHLGHYGYATDLEQLAKDIQSVLASSAPDKNTADVARGLLGELAFKEDAKTLIVE